MLALDGGTPVVAEGAVAPWPQVTDEDRHAVLRAMDRATPWHWPMDEVRDLERAWSEWTGMPHVLAANSGTAALHMAVAAAGVEPGDEVIVPADTFLATASCVLQANAIPVFADTDRGTFAIDPDRVAERVTGRTRAVIAVDLNGLPADYAALRAVADRHGLALIEDAAQAHGARYRGEPVGGLADSSAASLNGSKCLSALGEGGLFATRDAEQFRLARRVSMFGEELAGQGRDYNARIMGWNYRIDVLAAAFARSQLARLARSTEVREANGAALTKALAEVPGIRPPIVPDDRTHVYFFYPLLVQPEELDLDLPVDVFRDAVEKAVAAEGLGIARWQPRPVPAQLLFQELRGYGKGCPWTCGHARPGHSYRDLDYPVAEDVCLRRLVLGQSFSSLGPPNTARTMELFAEALHKVLVEERDALVKLARDGMKG
ncbi:DegT/DnrJ/EryC1/StrS family aminotransferase [Saccharothrix australiensis]|uniref:dTDP-4-amino-4,6-dideoxygalactose transaminase n=1 Tax=Saccharothrix australiensis TaxID=2072 RepID=A0A495VXY0_9PSEU|nr:DegT/DnrJ/EryC1/StrS family aminotransferase [Saccharothrix australiensis]RKT53690.1 dTDP-4-amino-4,6-dideoxygalactose transaminase [Saccharothrix australiensis]